MFSKLAVKNVRRSLKDYSVYFLTLTFGVCVFYVFNSLEDQGAMRLLGSARADMVAAIMTFMDVFSVFVSVVLAGLILYANTFLMKRRKREIGTYFLLGLPTGKVSLLLVLETLLIGLLALGTGLLLGMLASHGLGALTLAMFSATEEALHFVFSVGAIGKTVLYFGVIFVVVMVFTSLSVSRAKLLDLMQGGRKNEEMRERPLWTAVVLFLLGVVLLGTAYWLLGKNGLLSMGGEFFLMLALGTAGTLLFFRSLSGFLLRMVKSCKGFYYRGLNMFVLRQFNSRVHTTYLSMTVVCLLLLLAIGITACSVGLNNVMEELTSQAAPYDATVINYGYEGENTEQLTDIPDLLVAAGLDLGASTTQAHTFSLYYNDPAVTGVSDGMAYAAMALADVNRALEMQGGKPMTLVDGAPALVEAPLFDGDGAQSSGLLAVPDEMAQGLRVRRQMTNLIYRGDKQTAENALTAALSSEEMSAVSVMVNSRLQQYWDNMGSKLLVLYVGLYLGIMFLVTAAAVLALQQLSQAADNGPRYEILTKLGAEKKMRDGAIFTQVLLAFLLPLLLAIVHAAVGMRAANAVIAELGKVDTVASSALTAAFILLIYGAYFVATYWGSKRAAQK